MKYRFKAVFLDSIEYPYPDWFHEWGLEDIDTDYPDKVGSIGYIHTDNSKQPVKTSDWVIVCRETGKTTVMTDEQMDALI